MIIKISAVRASYSILIILLCCRNLALGSHPALNLNGAHLKIVVTQNPPWDTVIRGPNGTFTYNGTTRHIITWLSKKLHFTCTFIYPSEEEEKVGAKAAGLNLIIKKQADLTAFSNTNTPERRKFMDFVRFFGWQDDYRLITPKPGEQDRLFSFVRPFDPMVWLVLGISVLATISVMSIANIVLSNKIAKKKAKTNQSMNTGVLCELPHIGKVLITHSLYLINTLTNHGDYLLNELSVISFFTVVYFWLLGASVLVYSYSSIIVSSLTAPTMKPSINSYEDLVTNSEVTLLITSDMSLGQSILRGDNDIYKKLADKARRYPESITHNYETRDSLLLTGRYAYVHQDTFCRSFVANLYKKEKICRFELSDTLRQPSYNYYFLAVVKDSPYIDALTVGLMQLWETGLSRYWTYSPIPKADGCFNKQQRNGSNQQRTLSLDDFAGAFLILSIGVGLSLVTFALETFRALEQNKRHNED